MVISKTKSPFLRKRSTIFYLYFFSDFKLISRSFCFYFFQISILFLILFLTPLLPHTTIERDARVHITSRLFCFPRLYLAAVCRRCFLRIEKSDEKFFFYKKLKSFLYYLLTKGTWLKLFFP